MIEHLIFDFGGVFLYLEGENRAVHYNLHKLLDIPEEKAVEIWKEHKENLLIGKETPKEFLVRMNALMGTNLHPDITHDSWLSMNKIENHQIKWDLVDYVETLSKKYKIHMLTNNIDLNDKSESYNSATKHFKNIFQSFEMGHKKPNKKAFLYVLEKINAKPEECIFVDDIQKNVDAANNLSIKGILYTNLNKLKKDFAELYVT